MKKYFPIVILLILACSKEPKESENKINDNYLESQYDSLLAPFYYGVASGDPLPNQIILWTKVSVNPDSKQVNVKWEIAEDESFNKVVNRGVVTSLIDDDYSVKVDVKELAPNTRYYYRFAFENRYSQIGITKTAALNNVDSLKFAVISCSNFEFGYFNAYGSLAKRTDLDAILHLGDYIYEYAPGIYGDTLIGRMHYPPKELITLDDYRKRYAQYRLDKNLQAAHQNHPFIAIWDDHEIANDAYLEGAKNHQANEGPYQQRKSAAKKAYYEWLPVRESQHLYRNFNYGELVDIIMLDERLEGRTAPAENLEDPIIKDTSRTMLGNDQVEWLEEQLTKSDAQWKIIGNQVIFSYLNWGFPSWDINMDSWDGYPIEREKIKNIIVGSEINNVVFVTGDTHSSWAFEVTDDPFNGYDSATSEGAYAIEFGTTSINSSNSDESMPTDSVIMHEKKIVNTPLNPHLKYANLRDHGYLIVTPSKTTIKAEWYFVETLLEPNEKAFLAKTIVVEDGSVDIK